MRGVSQTGSAHRTSMWLAPGWSQVSGSVLEWTSWDSDSAKPGRLESTCCTKSEVFMQHATVRILRRAWSNVCKDAWCAQIILFSCRIELLYRPTARQFDLSDACFLTPTPAYRQKLMRLSSHLSRMQQLLSIYDESGINPVYTPVSRPLQLTRTSDLPACGQSVINLKST